MADDQPLQRQRSATQRRVEDAVGGIGVIESGLPPRVRRKDSNLRSSDLVSERSYNAPSTHSGGARSRGTVRTNRRMSLMVGRASRDTGNEIMPEGRARVAKCEVAERRFCGVAGIAGKGARKTILHPLRVDVPPGSVTAILGTAESGKSTLLKFLAGCMDNNMIYEGAVNFPGSQAYLPRETYLHRFYTPRTYIEHYDRLMSTDAGGGCCVWNRGGDVNGSNVSNAVENTGGRRRLYHRNSSVSSAMTTSDIENLLDSLRIDRDRRDTIVGDAFGRGLNPGEQRRLELGLLVLGAPDVLFCEDPVEGLDSETALHVMEFLKGYITNSNRRVVVTLNKPSQFIWSLIDNAVLLSKGRVVYEGPRFDMESFFAFHKRPTPARFSPLEHYLAVVNNFRQSNAAVNWETALKEWQEEADEDEGDDLADDIELCFPTAIPDVHIPQTNHERSGAPQKLCCCGSRCNTFCELLRRYILNMLRNPGMLLIRFVMYTALSLILGVLFFDVQQDESYLAVNPRAALLFYSSSFYIFMIVSILPFLANDLQIRDKETLNGFYHPATHHLASAVASIPAVLILALVISLILVGMVKLQGAVNFFVILALALWCAESAAFLMSILVRNYIIGIVLLAGMFGMAMAVEGFMLVPSIFPAWLQWTYYVPFHTYAWRSLMYNEFAGSPSGMAVLEAYEIQESNIYNDMIVLLFYSVAIHLACLGMVVLLGSQSSSVQKMKKS